MILKFSSVMSVSMTSLIRRIWSPCSGVWRSELGFKAVNAMLWSPHHRHQCLCTSCTATDLSLNLDKVDDHKEVDRQNITSIKLRKRRRKKVQVSLKKEKEELSINWLFSLSAGDSSSSAMTAGGLQAEEADRSLELPDTDGLLQLPPTPTPASTYSNNAWVLGIDPDITGAVAVLKPQHSGSPAQVYDAPNVEVFIGKRVRKRLDVRSIVSLLRDLEAPAGSLAYIEQSRPFPNDGKQGWWSGGFGYGLWIGTLVASGFSVIPIPSMVWKKHFDLPGGTSQKDESRAVACSLFASLSPQLKRKKDHGRAEALLIAAYGRSLMKITERDPKAG